MRFTGNINIIKIYKSSKTIKISLPVYGSGCPIHIIINFKSFKVKLLIISSILFYYKNLHSIRYGRKKHRSIIGKIITSTSTFGYQHYINNNSKWEKDVEKK